MTCSNKPNQEAPIQVHDLYRGHYCLAVRPPSRGVQMRLGERVVQLAELIRLWGEPPNAPPPTDDTQQAMLEELRAMRRELIALREEVAQLRMLPAPKVDKVDRVDSTQDWPETPQEPRKADTPPEDKRNELRNLVAALRQSQG